MKVLWTVSALAQLQAIHDYLAQTSPDYAVRIIDRFKTFVTVWMSEINAAIEKVKPGELARIGGS